jgi:hypothetical protein
MSEGDSIHHEIAANSSGLTQDQATIRIARRMQHATLRTFLSLSLSLKNVRYASHWTYIFICSDLVRRKLCIQITQQTD